MILYFSGSGNSLALSRRLAEATNDRVISMYEAVDYDLGDEPSVGIVFPTYMLDAPIAVRQLVPKITFPHNAYTYLIITCGAQTNNAVWTVRRLLKQQGVKLDYCHKIRMPDSSALAFGRNPNDQKWKFERYEKRLQTILEDVTHKKCRYHFAGFDPVGWLLSRESIAVKTNKTLTPNANAAKCIGCGTCARVCPQGNISMAEGKACVHKNCTLCLSCVHFCPHQAMEVNGKTIVPHFQYHHPDITLKDMLKR